MTTLAAADHSTDPVALAQTWKTSCFVWVRNSIATSDLSDETHPLTAIEKEILAALKVAPADIQTLADKLACSLADTAPVLRGLADRLLLVPGEEDESRKFSVNRVDIEQARIATRAACIAP